MNRDEPLVELAGGMQLDYPKFKERWTVICVDESMDTIIVSVKGLHNVMSLKHVRVNLYKGELKII